MSESTTDVAKSADTKPADAKPTDAKPTDAKPTDAKPADTRPADAKPTDAIEVSFFQRRLNATPPRRPRIDKLFEKENLISGNVGTPIDIPHFDRHVECLQKAGYIVIAGYDGGVCSWAGSSLANQCKYSAYSATWVDTSGITIRELVNKLITHGKGTCLILDWTDPSAGRSCAGFFGKFLLAVKELAGEPNALIVYVRSDTLRALEAIDDWENNPILELPDPRQTKTTDQTPEQRMEKIFAPSVDDTGDFLEALIAKQNRLLIPRTLVQLAVVFPGLSTSSFERLLERVLGDTKVEVTPAKENIGAKEARLWDLWTSGRAMFERRSGLTRIPSRSVTALRFESEEMREAAEQWIWRYPEDLLGIFVSISRLGILFSDSVDDEEERLLNAYILATVELAHRATALFGVRWLEAILHDYAWWVQAQTAEAELPATDLFEFLARIDRQEKSEKRSRLWERFSERMGSLASVLLQDQSLDIVYKFFDGLMRKELHGLVLDIISNIEDVLPEERRVEWLKRVIEEGDETARQAAMRELARRASQRPSRASAYLRQLQEWLEEESNDGDSKTREAAIVFPVYLFSVPEEPEFDPKGATSPLVEVMNVSDSFREYCEKAVAEPSFAALVARDFLSKEISEEDQPSLALALALYRCAAALPDSQIEIALGLAQCSFNAIPMAGQNRVRRWWKVAADDFGNRLRANRNPAPGKETRERKEIERRYEVAINLVRH